MEENVQMLGYWLSSTHVIALGDVSLEKEITMTHTRYAFIKASWHAEIVDKALEGFIQKIPKENIDVFDVPGAFEMPLLARDLASSGRYSAVVAAAFVVDGAIYRHDFIAQTVVTGLMQAGLESGVPVLSVSLTPHQYQDTEHHNAIHSKHFVEKGKEAAQAALKLMHLKELMAA